MRINSTAFFKGGGKSLSLVTEDSPLIITLRGKDSYFVTKVVESKENKDVVATSSDLYSCGCMKWTGIEICGIHGRC
jgi:hypothetical protein